MTTHPATSQIDALLQQASRHIQNGKLPQARQSLQQVLALEPRHLPARLELAQTLVLQNHWQDSTQVLLDAMQHLPRHAMLLIKLSQQLLAHGEILAARSCLALLAQAPDPPTHVLLAQAHLRFTLGEILPARALIERALAEGADDPDDHYMHAMLLQFSGELTAACQVLIDTLKRWPGYGDAAVVLANLHKHAPDTDVLALVEHQLSRHIHHESEQDQRFVLANFHYARYRLLDEAGHADEAWNELAECNRLMHALNPYDAAAQTRTVDALCKVALASRTAPPLPPADGPMPIFIVGLPRSGTTLLERILSSHSQVAAAGEITDFWRQLHWEADVVPKGSTSLGEIALRADKLNLSRVGARYLERTRWRANGARFYIDKLPANIELVPFIRQALPQARIIHIHRPAMDVCFSNFKALFGNAAPYSYEQEALAHYYGLYRRLVHQWQDDLPDAMLDLPYAELVGSTSETVQRVLAWCGLAMEEACLRPERNQGAVATPSNAQVREPIHKTAHDSWMNYARQLEPLREALARQGY